MNDRYIIEREFEHAGYKCVVIFGAMGHRCGYVGVPKNHPLYGKGYDDYLEIKKSDIGDRKISGIIPLFLACLDEDERVRKSDLWWFGFDCGHAGDKADLDYAIMKFPNHREQLIIRKSIEDKYPIDGDIIRTESYVAEECERLAEQLKEFEVVK